MYCEKPFFKIVRHIEDVHKREDEVEKLTRLAVKSDDTPETKKRKLELRKEIGDELRRKGNFQHNFKVLRQGHGELTVKKCPKNETAYTEFLPCEFCMEFYFRKDLHRHVKTCSQRKDHLTQSKGFRVQSRASMLLPIPSMVSQDLKKIFERMRVDDVSLALKMDTIIIKYGNMLCRKHFNNDDQTYHISNKLRELGRLLLHMQKQKLVNKFEEIISPKMFPHLIKCVMELCGWDEEARTIDVPSLGIKLGQILSKVSCMVKGDCIISGDISRRNAADDLDTLITLRWNDEIAKLSRTELETRKWNKPQLLPLTEDLKALKNHLSSVRKESVNILAKHADMQSYRNLCSSTLALLILLNRRRTGEASKLQLKHLDTLDRGNEMNDQIKSSLSKFELELCKTYKRVEVRGKRGRKVPMLLSRDIEASIQLLVNVRDSIGVNSSNKYVFAVPTANSLNFLRGSDALRKHAKLAGLKCPQSVTSTKLRKHIATLSQLINLEERELEMLAGFLGHDPKIHKEFYRLPEDTLQIAKCGKLLMMMDQDRIGEFAGKSLDEIELNNCGKYFLYLKNLTYYKYKSYVCLKCERLWNTITVFIFFMSILMIRNSK